MAKNKSAFIILALVLLIGFVAYKKLNQSTQPQSETTDVNPQSEASDSSNLAPSEPSEASEAQDEENDSELAQDDEQTEPSIAPESTEQASDESEDELESEFKDQISKAIATQINADYADLFASLNLAPEKKAQLEAHFVENKELQQDLIMMLMDENKSIEEIMDKQDSLASDQQKKLEKILTEDQLVALNEYNDKLPEKNLNKQIDNILDGVELPAESRQQIKDIFVEEEFRDYKEGKSLNMIQSKHTLDFKPDQLKMFREIMAGSQNNDPTAIKANLKYEEQRMERILSRVPENYRQAIKDKLEVSLNIQRNVIKMMENQSDS